MKKIIATVLAMVMALALCTTAFAAATTGTKSTASIDVKGYKMYTLGPKNVVGSTITGITKITHENNVAEDGTITYFADIYKVEFSSVTYYFAAVALSAATHSLENGSTVVYLKYTGTVEPEVTTTIKVTNKIDAKASADQTCGDYRVDVYVGDEAYAVPSYPTDTYAVYNNEFVEIGETQTAIKHNFTTNTTVVDGKITAVKCDTCKKSFTVTQTKDKTWKDSDFEELSAAAGNYVVLKTGTTTPSTDKNTSPKTFDAGIAMYVGMALTSVAGSAVVIGKKKEF